MAEWQNGGIAEWNFTTYLIYAVLFMVHDDDAADNDANDANNDANDIDDF